MTGKQLRNSILQWAIQGKLVPQDPNDEPASVLLKRIRAEKARLVKEKKIKKDKNESIIYRGEDNSYYEKMADGTVRCIDDEIPFEIPSSWEWTRLHSLISRFSTGPFGTMLHKEDYSDDGVPVINPINIKDSVISDIKVKKVNLKKYKELSAYKAYEGDLILARRGDLSKCAIISKQQEGWIAGTGSFILRILEVYEPYFILCYKSTFCQDYLLSDSIGTTMDNLNQSLLRNLLIPIPPFKEQNRIVTSVSVLDSKIQGYCLLQKQLNWINSDIRNKLYKSILQDAIQGKLVPQIESAGNAEELLDAIRAEKMRLVKEGRLKKSAIANESRIYRGEDNRYYEQIGSKTLDITEEIPFAIPDGWCWIRVESIFEINPKNDVSDELEAAFVPMTCIEAGYGSGFTFIQSKWGQIKRGYAHFADGDIGVAKITPCFQNRKSVIFTGLPNGIGAGTTELKILRPYANRIIAEYVLMFLQSPYFIDDATFKGTANQQRIVSGYLENKLFPLPPLHEQERIVDRLENFLASILGR